MDRAPADIAQCTLVREQQRRLAVAAGAGYPDVRPVDGCKVELVKLRPSVDQTIDGDGSSERKTALHGQQYTVQYGISHTDAC